MQSTKCCNAMITQYHSKLSHCAVVSSSIFLWLDCLRIEFFITILPMRSSTPVNDPELKIRSNFSSVPWNSSSSEQSGDLPSGQPHTCPMRTSSLRIVKLKLFLSWLRTLYTRIMISPVSVPKEEIYPWNPPILISRLGNDSSGHEEVWFALKKWTVHSFIVSSYSPLSSRFALATCRPPLSVIWTLLEDNLGMCCFPNFSFDDVSRIDLESMLIRCIVDWFSIDGINQSDNNFFENMMYQVDKYLRCWEPLVLIFSIHYEGYYTSNMAHFLYTKLVLPGTMIRRRYYLKHYFTVSRKKVIKKKHAS